jgi:hypothetical protein
MKLQRVVLLTGLGLAAAALAQETSNYDGKWRGMFNSRNGKSRQAELVVTGQGGSWTYARENGKWDDACMGPQFPVSVVSRSATELKLRIDGEKVLKGCGERGVTLKPSSDGASIAGTFDDNGHEVKFTRR